MRLDVAHRALPEGAGEEPEETLEEELQERFGELDTAKSEAGEGPHFKQPLPVTHEQTDASFRSAETHIAERNAPLSSAANLSAADLSATDSSAAESSDSQTRSGETSTSKTSSGAVDPKLVAETKRRVEELAREIAELAHSDRPLDDFCRGFLDRVVTALAAEGGGVWHVGGDASPRLECEINLTRDHEEVDDGDSDERARRVNHRALVTASAGAGQPISMPPKSRLSEGDAVNESDLLVLLAPVTVAGRVQLVVEILRRPGSGPVTQRGYLRFLVQMCSLAAEYLKGHRLREYRERDSLWKRLESFLIELHGGLDLRRTLFTIANDGRQLIGCDRLSVAICRGRRCHVEAVSGLDSFDKRAQEVKRLGRLARAVVAAGEPLWFDGAGGDLPPQIEAVLHSYIDRAHARRVVVLPMARPSQSGDGGAASCEPPVGALIVEQLAAGDDPPHFRQRTELVARHSAAALANAVDHDGLFLLPLWRTIGRMRWVVEARNLPKVILATVAFFMLLLGLCLTPYHFDISSGGVLRPHIRREVFAGIDGIVVDVPVEHLQHVTEGEIVARLRNTELEVEIESLLGQRTSKREQMLAIQRALLDARLAPQEQNRLNGELATLKETADSVERMLALVKEKQKRLEIAAPTTGQVSTWQVRDLLLRRPVQSGQRLMTVIDPTGDWELELRVPERRMRHLVDAQLAGDAPLDVTFVLATHPDTRLAGRVVHLDRSAEVRDAEGNTVLVRVAIDKTELPDLRDGAKVTARIHCGTRPLGYVLFHDLIETVQAKVLFWL